MIIDYLENLHYYAFQPHLLQAFSFLQQPELFAIPDGKYEIDGLRIFALVNSYETVLPELEFMESHLKYIDIHYVVSGQELIGHGFLHQQPQQKQVDVVNDCITYTSYPSFYSKLEAGMFGVFFPNDMHMPGIQNDKKFFVKKIVLKVALSNTTI
ncbi:MAG: YhcH/YjgK/YiaL family protein [Bacteroidota bacterium]|jgi:YhcH/YjgK/YiaL family protein|nr:YhcH/YjgK/YiaL family protein [Bacteroidota bacterium]